MRNVWSVLFVFLLPSVCWAVPDTTMTITPSATAGTTITAADENSRNNTITTAYNAHSHTDLTITTSNSWTVGNGLSGSKSFVIDNQFTTAPSIRYSDTLERWQFTNNTTTFNDFANINQTTFTIGNGTANNIALAISNSFTTNPALRYNRVSEQWEFSNDATTYNRMATTRQGLVTMGSSTGITVTSYCDPGSCNATEGNVRGWQPGTAFVASNLMCSVNASPGGGASWTITLRRATVNTALTCTISGGSARCQDTTNTTTFATGDDVDIGWVAAAAPANSVEQFCTFFIR